MDPFFAFRQSWSLKSWETIEIGIKNGMSGEVTFDHFESKCVVVKNDFKRFYLILTAFRMPKRKKGPFPADWI